MKLVMTIGALIIIGSSTGGPKTLKKLLSGMPTIDASIIIVQHMPKFINETLRGSLDSCTSMNVKIAEDNEFIEQGNIYIAPSEVHLELIYNQKIRLYHGEKVNFVCPSIDVTMKSLQPNHRTKVIGVILTSMGKDGAQGVIHIKKIGGITIAQDAESSVIYGMPKAAYETGAVDMVLPPEKIQEKLIQLTKF